MEVKRQPVHGITHDIRSREYLHAKRLRDRVYNYRPPALRGLGQRLDSLISQSAVTAGMHGLGKSDADGRHPSAQTNKRWATARTKALIELDG